MKKLILFVPLFLLLTACIGQQKFNKPEVKAKAITFVCEDINDLSSDITRVHNKNNSLQETQKSHFGELSAPLPLTDRKKFIQAFWDAFGEERLKNLLPERIPISFCIDKKGKILEISYILSKNTLITPVELEKLENNILKNVSFNLRPEYIVKGDYFFLLMNNSFRMMLNKE